LTYNEALAYISSFEAFGIRPGLERIEALCKALNNPQDRLKFIHVAGTNGKGSTSTLIANSLAGSGHKVGLFTSPYVVDFRERFSINGEMISKTELAALVDDIKPKVDELAPNLIPTEFELITALAFLYFYLNNCDYVVLEVGLGGRFDSTNIIKRPLVSVITSVSKDHMAVLGDTIEKIAFEKAGIIKPNVPVVLYPLQAAEAYEVITEVAKYQKSDLFIPSLEELSIIDQSIFGSNFSYKNVIYSLALMGEHMIYNAITALTALELLKDGGHVVDDNAVSRALEKTQMAGRLEIYSKKPLVIFDGGHNEGCALALEKVFKTYLAGYRIIGITCLMADKDYDTYLKILAPCFDTLIASSIDYSRALSAEKLADHAKAYCSKVIVEKDVFNAYQLGLSRVSGEKDVLVVCGSFYFLSDLRKRISEVPV